MPTLRNSIIGPLQELLSPSHAFAITAPHMRDTPVVTGASPNTSPTARVDASPKEVAARTELHQMETLTLSDQQFLTGDAAGKPVVISGHLRIAQGCAPFPAVILQHGSSGYAANIEIWSRTLNALGISTFALDGFTGRGLVEVNSNQALLGRLNFILDIYRALGVVASHPLIDPSRIALMGFSRGGQAALYASLKRFNRMWNATGAEFAAYIPFYPDCMTSFMSDTDVVDRPIRIFGGTLDDYNPVSNCRNYVDRLRTTGADVTLTEYADASHAFDNPLAARPAAVSPAFQSLRNCKIRENGDSLLMNAETGRPFTYGDACVAYGAHLGYQPVAAQAAREAVETFMKSLFDLD
jgi:dienelactone hydrolase